ncbi:MAG: hypothetical protein JW741_06085 [Sedimentisphaerales bacterium]|nr:hypothetical protein [Sedimentisphaerales bacterium]
MSEDQIRYWMDRLDFLTVEQLYQLVDAIEANTEMTVVAVANLALRVKRHLRSRGLPGVRVDAPRVIQLYGQPLPTRVGPYGVFQVRVAGGWHRRRAFTEECPNCLMPVAYYRDGGVVRGVCHTCGYQVVEAIAWIRRRNPRRQGHGWERIKRLPAVREEWRQAYVYVFE